MNLKIIVFTIIFGLAKSAVAYNKFADYETLATSGKFPICDGACFADKIFESEVKCETTVSKKISELREKISNNTEVKTQCSEVLTYVEINDASFSRDEVAGSVRVNYYQKIVSVSILCKPRPLSETVLASLLQTCTQSYTQECAGYLKRLDAVRPTKFPSETNGNCR